MPLEPPLKPDEHEFIGFHCENCGLIPEADEMQLLGMGLAGKPGFTCPICTNMVFPAWKSLSATQRFPKQETYRLAEIARLLDVSHTAVYGWAKQGLLETIQSKPRQHRRVTHAELARFLAASGLSLADCEAGLLTVDEVTRLLNVKKALLVSFPDLQIADFGLHKCQLRKISQRALDKFLRACGGRLADLAAGPLLTKSEVRSLLRLSQSTLDRMTRAGVVPLIHLTTRTVRISRVALDNFLQARGGSLAGAEQGYLNQTEYMEQQSLSKAETYLRIDKGELPGAFRLTGHTWLIPNANSD